MIFLLCIFATKVSAESSYPSMPKEYENIKNFIPENIFELLPSDLFSNDTENVHDAVNEITSLDYVTNIIAAILNAEIKSSIDLLLILSGAVMMCALINGLNSQSLGTSGGEISKFICNILIVSVLLSSCSDIFSCSKIFFDRLNLFMTGMLPFLCVLSAMGGGVASAAAANYGISTFIAVSELALSKSVTPIAGACISLAAVGAVSETSAGSSLLKGLKKLYIFLIGMLMTLMLFMFSARGIMAHSADTLGGRAIKFAAGSFIPIVGANIGDILKGVGSGIAYLKSTLGVISVIILLLTLLPTFISILVRRVALSICASLADLIGANEQSKVINEFASVYGMLLAVVSMSSVLFIGAVIISVRIGNAVA